MSKTIFVTGGAGYVGSHCCKAFAAQGWNVVVFDNLSRGWRDLVRWGPLIEGDLLDPESLDKALRDAKPDLVAHFAALAYVGESVADPSAYYRNNTVGAINLLDAMRRAGVDALLFSSTCATYAPPGAEPVDETRPQAPISPYGRSKLMVEHILADYDRAYGMRHVALRYFNAAGADASAEIGERHVPETHAIPLAIEAALDERREFTIFGDNFETRDGTCVRDYVHVADLADAHTRAARRLIDGSKSDAFNLGTGIGVTVAEILDAVRRTSGRPLRAKIGPRRDGDPASIVAAYAKAKSVLGWTPEHSGIDNVIETALRWRLKDGARN